MKYLYIHIPFCESKCGYCAFASTTSRAHIDRYFQALHKDIAYELSLLDGEQIASVYFGGGTPSSVDARYYDDIFALISPHLLADVEISAEANPSSLNAAWLAHMRSLGLNRLSLGVQSFVDSKLAHLERAHTSKEALAAIELARLQMDNVSIDLIYATPWDEPERELKQLASLGLKHFSAYTLLIEPNTPFARAGLAEAPAEQTVEYYRALSEILPPYEASNFAASGYECRHNLSYWDGSEYIGCGLSAVGARNINVVSRFPGWARFSASSKMSEYLKDPSAKSIEQISAEDRRLERLFLGLRSIVGADIKDCELSRLKELIKEGLVSLKANRVIARDFLLADELALFLSV